MRPSTAYQILAVPIGATREQIDNNYRKLAIKHHPDLHPDDPYALKKFKEITEAYELLRNRVVRRAYDEAIKSNKIKFPRINYWKLSRNLKKKRRRRR